jgi:hypothetical protein
LCNSDIQVEHIRILYWIFLLSFRIGYEYPRW